MPWIKIRLHFVWATKNHAPYLVDDIRYKIFDHIRNNAKEKGIFIDHINGYLDHVHCLISLSSDQTIDKIMQLIKGESSFWIDQNRLTKTRFAWQDEYFVVSVDPGGLGGVRRYIANQEVHHRKVVFDDEFQYFLERAGFQKFKDVG